MSDEPTAFLYPFIDGDERDVDGLLASLEGSARTKLSDSAATTNQALAELDAQIERAAADLAHRVQAGGRVLTFGNGGSATDAAAFAGLLAGPPSGPALAAVCLTAEPAVLTALANDVGFEKVFARQVEALGQPDDVAVGLSTSGHSANVASALDWARRLGMLTVAVAGYDGGRLAGQGLDHCLVVRSDSVHRIQEAQTRITYELWRRVQARLTDLAAATETVL